MGKGIEVEFRWNYKRAFVRCALLLAAGSVLQIAAGDVPAALLRYPWSAVLAVNYLYLLVLALSFSGRSGWLRSLWDEKACVSSLATLLLLVTVSGFFRITATWPFVFLLLYFMTATGIRAVSEIGSLRRQSGICAGNKVFFRSLARTALHTGVFLVLWAGLFGSGDKERYRMEIHAGRPAVMAETESGVMKALPFSVTLREFSIDEYPPELHIFDTVSGRLSEDFLSATAAGAEAEVGGWLLKADTCLSMAGRMPGDSIYREMKHTGAAPAVFVTAVQKSTGKSESGWVSCGSHIFSPLALSLDDSCMVVMPGLDAKGYLAGITVTDSKGRDHDFVTEVNSPARLGVWRIYLVGYDTSRGRWSTSIVLECVKDPWYWLIHAALWVVLVSGILMFMSVGITESGARQRADGSQEERRENDLG